MENRTRTRGRQARGTEDAKTAGSGKRSSATPSTRASPGRRGRISPVRRSSRPRSSASVATVTISSVVPPSPIVEVKEVDKSPKARDSPRPLDSAKPRDSPKARESPRTRPKATTPITRSSPITKRSPISRSPIKTPSKSTTTVQSSSYSSTTTTTTQKTVERSGNLSAKLSDYIRRSVSKTILGTTGREGTQTPTTNTEADGSRYSRSVSRSVYDDEAVEFSDAESKAGEDEDHFKSLNASGITNQLAFNSALLCRKPEVPREFGGWLGALTLLLAVPVGVYYLQWCCSKSGCQLRTPNLKALLDVNYIIKELLAARLVGLYLGLFFGICVLSAALFGRTVHLAQERLTYTFNVLPNALLTTLAFGVAQIYFKYPVADYVIKYHLHLCLYNIIMALVVSLWAYWRPSLVKGKDQTLANAYGKTGNFLIDFAQGRQVNPKWLGIVEFKQIFSSVSLILTLLIAESLLYKSVRVPWLEGREGLWNITQFYAQYTKYDPGAVLTAGNLLLYVADSILFEHHLASSFELQGEGFGALLLLRYALTPFLLSGVAKYFYDNRLPIDCKWGAYIAVALLLTGLILKRLSCAVKYKYRIDPNNRIFYGVNTIHTFQGRRLLLGSLWGRLRQPNYAGEILALCGLATPIFLNFAWPPLIGLLLLVVQLLHRARRVNVRNLSRYHSSWVRYCSTVRNYIVPKVY